MIATALQIQDATGDAVINIETLIRARDIFRNRDIVSDEEFQSMLFEYSAHLSALTASMVTTVLLTEEQFTQMNNEIREFDNMAKDVK